MQETWKPVTGFEEHYLVSNTGKVYSLRKDRVLTPVINKATGYYTVVLCGNHSHKNEYIHRIVATAFCDKPDGCTCVNHKDENRQNNNADNLEWCTIAYNNQYSNVYQSRRRPIAQMKNGKVIRIWESAREAEKHLNTNYKNISAVCRGLRPRAGGYEWRFV